MRSIILVLLCVLITPTLASGQGGAPGEASIAGAGAGSAGDLPFAIAGPPPPVPPSVITRDESGRATIRAVRLTTVLRVDGKLDESIYETVPAIADFIQMEPQLGSPATEKTEVWLLFDRDRVYVSVRCWESRMDRLVANEMRRDGTANWQGNDIVSFIFDTFYDRRNGVEFTINALGGRSDGQITNERQYNGDWNPIWEVQTGRFDGGWTIEAAVPFKSVRYRPGQAQIWGFNVFRTNRWKNELSFLVPMPPGRGQSGLSQASLAATVVGLEAPSGSKNLEVKPFAISSLNTDARATPAVRNDPRGDVGLDVKYGVTQNVTADFTYNTDFAQVEADEQQVNLTRFNLQFPEKREFFLENRGLFQFAGAGPGNFAGGGGGGTAGAGFAGGGDAPQLFYSRRIGLNENGPVPVLVPISFGSRVTGRVGRYSLGALGMRTDEDAASAARPTMFSVVRVSRDLLRRSSVGVMFTGRSVGRRGIGTNEAFGVDGNFAFFTDLSINTYWARTRTDGLEGDDTSYRAQLDYNGDRYGVQVERLVIGDHFNPEVGFVRRDDLRLASAQFRFSPRLRSMAAIRKLFYRVDAQYIENGRQQLESRKFGGEFAIEFQNADRFFVNYESSHEFLPNAFPIATHVTIPVGGYRFARTQVGFNLGQQRTISATMRAEHGTFFSGHRTAVEVSRGRLNLTPQFSMEPTYSVNRVSLREGSFTTQLAGARVTFTMTPQMFTSALVQYNTTLAALTANVRLRWEYRPGSELFVVYNEQRDTLARAFPELANRALIVKVNRLFRF